MNAASEAAIIPEWLLPPSGRTPATVRRAEIIGALSYALDLTEGQPPGHCLRCCWIGMHIGERLGLDTPTRADLYYTLLLKDTGCSSNAARLWELYGGDDLLTKRDFKLVDSQSLLQLARFVLRHAGPGEAMRTRFKRLVHLLRHGETLATELVHTRCERGADIVRRLGFSTRVADSIFSLDEHWNGKGRPQGLRGEAIPIGARIALFAQVVDVFHTVGGEQAVATEVRRRTHTWFDPQVSRAFFAAARRREFWTGLQAQGLKERVLALEPSAGSLHVDEPLLDSIAAAFADIIDAKSNFTYGHSQRVAGYAEALGIELGLPAPRRAWLRRGALLHDIGKLGVSNGILDKPGRLDAEEWTAVKRHARYTEEILARVGVFGELAPIAGAHHERLDGTGYPKRLAGAAIPLETRIITACDIFDAITAARPYRGPMPLAEAFTLMERERDVAIDGRCLDALKRTTRTDPLPAR